MFLEKKGTNNLHHGWIEVITGPMFSGKTEELIRRLKRAQLANQKIEIYKPIIDTRFSNSDVVSHNALSISAIAVKSSQEILLSNSNTTVIGIDEAQFFDAGIIEVCNTLANNGKRIIIAGLDMDFKGQPFGSIPQLASIAEYVTKLNAICMQCGDLAHFSHRKSKTTDLIELGEQTNYEPLCRMCFNKLTTDNYASI
jgi:thymidine kinase